MMPAASLRAAKRLYVASMKNAGRGLTLAGVSAPEHSMSDQRWRHWAHTLPLIHDSEAMAALDVPWWTYDAIQAVDEWLANRSGTIRVFEYGSGASTCWLARRAGEVHSVEHHRGFGVAMQQRLREYDNVLLQVVEPLASVNPTVPSGKEGHQGLDFLPYVEAMEAVPGDFDLVVIDGRARAACLAKALPRLAADGMIVFDNSRRRRYRDAISASRYRETVLRGLTPTLPYPEQTSLLQA